MVMETKDKFQGGSDHHVNFAEGQRKVRALDSV